MGPVYNRPSVRCALPDGWERDSPVPGVKRPVFILGAVSLLTDISSEMVYPLVPLFLTSVLGAPLAAVGLIEGMAEGAASLLRTASGWLSDRLRRRRPLIVVGYALSAVAKPLLAATQVWPTVLGVRLLDRTGKGLRTAPRDALVADVTAPHLRGRAFGFHRGMDTLGAAIGPALGLGLLVALEGDFRSIFLLAFIPAAAGLAFLPLVGERRPPGPARRDGPSLRGLGPGFYVFLAVSLLFALGNSSDAFLILRARDVGLSQREAVSAYVAFNLVYAALALPAGVASDRLGRWEVIAVGFVIFAVVYLGLALAGTGALVWPLFALYGVFMALTDGVGRAMVADLVPAGGRATALGLYQGAMGGMILISSVLAGLLWDYLTPTAPFFLGGATALAALAALLLLAPLSLLRPARDR